MNKRQTFLSIVIVTSLIVVGVVGAFWVVNQPAAQPENAVGSVAAAPTPTATALPVGPAAAVSENRSDSDLQRVDEVENTPEVVVVVDAPVEVAFVKPTRTPLPSPTPVATPILTPTVPVAEVQREPVVISEPGDAVPDQVVISFAPDASAEERQVYLDALGGQVVEDIDALDTVVVQVERPAAGAAELPDAPEGLTVASEPDYYVTALLDLPADDPLLNAQWALDAINVPTAWFALPDDAPTVTVAVLDSGICPDHPDLERRITAGYDFVEDDDTPQDEFGHGCGVSGIIAANISNQQGIAGVAPNAQIMPLRVLDADGIGTYSAVAAAIVYAADNGADIINLSLGGYNESTTLAKAVDYAVENDVLVIAAAGNTGGQVLYPAVYEPVIAVGSVDESLERSSFSSHGDAIDLYAPGRDILTTERGGGYARMTGTSFAAPHVSGVAALEIAQGRELTATGEIVSAVGETITVSSGSEVIELLNLSPQVDLSAPPLFATTDTQGALSMDDHFATIRSRYVDINFDALSHDGAATAGVQSANTQSLLLNLFDDVTLTVDHVRTDPNTAVADGFVWFGRVRGVEGGEVYLTVGGGQLQGHVLLPGVMYQFSYAGDGTDDIHAISEIDLSRYTRSHNPPVPPKDNLQQGPTLPPVAAQNMAGVTIDVMVVYTSLARTNLGGTTAIQNQIQNSVSVTNQAYENSNVDQRIRLVHTQEISYNERAYTDDDHLDHLTYVDGIIDEVHTLRDIYNADLVSFVVADIWSFCGIAWVMDPFFYAIRDFDEWAFSIVAHDCLAGGTTLAHELGHNMGNEHNIEASGFWGGTFPYSYGYRDFSYPFRTIMSYSNGCPFPCTSLNYFSNQTVTYNGRVLGNSSADNATSMNNTAAFVSTFRLGESEFDDWRNAEVITSLPYNTTQDDVFLATVASDDPDMCVDGARSNTVWYKYTPGSDQYVSVSTIGSDYDTVLGVYTRAPDGWEEIACNDDIILGSWTESEVEFLAQFGVTYYFMIAEYDSLPALVDLNLTLSVENITNPTITAPVQISPESGSAQEQARPTYSWARQPLAKTYEIEIQRIGGSTFNYTTTELSFRQPSQVIVGDYTWRVRAFGIGADQSPWSAALPFSVISADTGSPRLVLYTTRTPTLTWNPVTWATDYQIQIDEDNDFGSPEVDAVLDAAVLSFTTPTLDDGRYRWRVRARRKDGSWGNWSEVDSFNIAS